MSQDPERLRESLDVPLPCPGELDFRADVARVAAWLSERWRTFDEGPIGRTGSHAQLHDSLAGPPPEMGRGFEPVLAEFGEKIAPFGLQLDHPRFLAFIPSTPTPASVVGDLLAAGTNYFCGTWLAGSGPIAVELVVLDWFRRLLGLPDSTRGLLTSGGSEANLTALLVARETVPQDDWPRAVLYISRERHASLDRAARVMGFRREQVRPIPVDAGFRLQPNALRQAIREDRLAGRLPWLIAANAGATNTGAIDPLEEIASIGQEEKLWFHADAAYGWSAALIEEGQHALKGIARADSVTLDPHKWFAQPFEAGCVLIREGHRLADAFWIRPDYMQDVTRPNTAEINMADCGLSLTRRFRALPIWLSVQTIGLGWFRQLVERCMRLADYAEAVLRKSPDFEILSLRQLSIVCFRYRPAKEDFGNATLDGLNRDLAERLRMSGQAFLSTTKLNNQVALRFCFVNWRTTAADVDHVVEMLRMLASERTKYHTQPPSQARG